MELADVLDILLQAKNNPHTNFTKFPFTKNENILGFRGGEHGQLHYGIRDGAFIANDQGCLGAFGGTLYAPTIIDANMYSMIRTNARCKGGRYDERTGEKLTGFIYGFPYLIAIDTKPYVGSRICDTGNPGEKLILGQISRKDVVILFDKSIINLKEVFSQAQFYQDLVKRRNLAFRE